MTRPAERVEELYGTWTLVSWTRRLLDTGETVVWKKLSEPAAR